MQLNWSTFILELINFVVLVWLLKRLLYKPVLNAIAERRKTVEKNLAEAEHARTQGHELQKEYENRLLGWEAEKEEKQRQFEHEIEEQRGRAMTALEAILAKEKERQKAVEARRTTELIRQQEKQALTLAGRFCSRLLTRIAGAELEDRILAVFLEDIANLTQERIEELKNGFRNHTEANAEVTTAYPLSPGQQSAVTSTLTALVGKEVSCRFRQDPTLVAGLCVALGPLVIRANLRDELHAFTSVDHLEH